MGDEREGMKNEQGVREERWRGRGKEGGRVDRKISIVVQVWYQALATCNYYFATTSEETPQNL